MTKRKGASSPANVPVDVLELLNQGKLETVTLAEGLAVDFGVLTEHVLPELAPKVRKGLEGVSGITGKMAAVGKVLQREAGQTHLSALKTHPSDTVRGWAAYLLAEAPGMTLEKRLEVIQPLADDPHFGVREWAWLAMRGHLIAELETAISTLSSWAIHSSPNVRRFASESVRPRGVWCAHIEPLKQNPALGLPILEPLKADSSRYVQDSVGNWLNDAAKSQPAWVKELCAGWLESSDTPATRYIVKRATRSL